jgi:hypothetical protein
MPTPAQKAAKIRKARVVADNKAALANVREYGKNQIAGAMSILKQVKSTASKNIATATANVKEVRARSASDVRAQIAKNKQNLVLVS